MSEFTSRNSDGKIPSPAEARARAAEIRAAAIEPEPSRVFGNVNQGARDSVDETFSSSNLGSFTFYQAHKAEIIAAAARGELPGQPNHATSPTN